MYARHLAKFRVRQVLLNSDTLEKAGEFFIDYRNIGVDIEGIQKMINRRRRKYQKLYNTSAQIKSVVADWNATKPKTYLSDGNLRNYVYASKRITLPALT